MQHSRQSKAKDTRGCESVFEHPYRPLLNEDHWSYLQKRYRMTNREVQVARLACQGFDNKKISRAMKIKQGTVKTHLRSIYQKTYVQSKITMLLKLMKSATKFSKKSQITPPIPIVDIEKVAKKAPAPAKIHKKGK